VILINSTPYCDRDVPDENLHLRGQLAGMACDRFEFHQLSVTGNWARSFSPFCRPSYSKSADTEFEHNEFIMFINDGDLPNCDMIVANFLGSELDDVKANNDLTMMAIYHLWRPSLLITTSWK
jgi:hypothetical protein